MACGGCLGRWPPQGLPVLPERAYRQNIEQLEKVRGEWEQEHRATCEVRHSRRGGCSRAMKWEGRRSPLPPLHGGEKRQCCGKGIIPSFIHSSTHSTGPVLSPCPWGAHRLALCSGSPFAGRHPSPLLAEAETEAQTKPIASLGSADEQGLGDRPQDSGSRAPLKTLPRVTLPHAWRKDRAGSPQAVQLPSPEASGAGTEVGVGMPRKSLSFRLGFSRRGLAGQPQLS